MSLAWNGGPPWTLLLFIAIVLIPALKAQGAGRLNMSMAEFVEGILSRKTYRSNVRPGIDSGTASVATLNIFVNSISSIDDFNMEYSMTFYLRQSWRDERLAYKQINKSVTLNYNDLHRIWVPDLFFRNEKAGKLHDITVPNRLIRLGPDGSILYSQRISLRLDCYMTLHKFPMDDQKCRMEIGSYGYTTADLVFKWKDFSALSIKENLELPEFQITSTKVGDCTRVFSTGSFACVYAEFHFDRKFEYYLLQTYIPSLLVVVLSWVSFWIDIEAVPARITLGLLTVLTMTTQASAISARLPRVSYIKGIDIWMATCLLFVFGALIEYSAVNVMYRMKKQKTKDEDEAAAAASNGLRQTPYSAVNVMYRSSQKQERNLAKARAAAAAAHAATNESEQDDGMDHDTLCNDRGDDYGFRNKPINMFGVTERGSQDGRWSPFHQGHHNDTNSKDMDETEVCLRGAEIRGLHTESEGFFASCFPQGGERKNRAIMVDHMSRFFFPVLFVMFNLVYWVLYGLVL